MFSWRLTLSGHPGITNEPLPLIAHTVPRGWRGRRFVDLGQQNRLNKKFTAMRRFFSISGNDRFGSRTRLCPDALIRVWDSALRLIFTTLQQRRDDPVHTGVNDRAAGKKFKCKKRFKKSSKARQGQLIDLGCCVSVFVDFLSFACGPVWSEGPFL